MRMAADCVSGGGTGRWLLIFQPDEHHHKPDRRTGSGQHLSVVRSMQGRHVDRGLGLELRIAANLDRQ